jgi:hypothetical protein
MLSLLINHQMADQGRCKRKQQERQAEGEDQGDHGNAGDGMPGRTQGSRCSQA